MAREKGTFNFSANLEVKKQGPLDARQTMITYAELTQAATWQDESGKMYLFNGLIVPVTNGSEKQLYMLIDAAKYNQSASWKRIDAGAAVSKEEVYFLPGDITTLTNGMTGSALQAVVGTYSALKAAIDAKKVILCNIQGTTGSVPISVRDLGTKVLISSVFWDKGGTKTTSFGIILNIGSSSAWATESATSGLYKKDLATTDDIPEIDVYKLPGDISTSIEESDASIKAVLGSVADVKMAIGEKKPIVGVVKGQLLNFIAKMEGSSSTYIRLSSLSEGVTYTLIANYSSSAWTSTSFSTTKTPNGISTGDKILKIEDLTGTISATVSLGYNSETKKLQLKGVNEEVFNELDATPFIKDGMLNSAELAQNPEGQAPGTYIKLVFNTDAGKDPIYINVTSLIDVYVQGNGISISGKTIAVKLDTAGNSEGYLKLTAAGLKVEGVNAAIAAAIAEAFSWHDAK